MDTPRLRSRERDPRNRFTLPAAIAPASFAALHHLVAARASEAGESPFAAHVQQLTGRRCYAPRAPRRPTRKHA